MKLTPSENRILSELIFQESFDHIRDETGLSYGAIRDDLIKLINHGFVAVFDEHLRNATSPFYDSDRIEQFYFQATSTGLKSIKRHGI